MKTSARLIPALSLVPVLLLSNCATAPKTATVVSGKVTHIEISPYQKSPNHAYTALTATRLGVLASGIGSGGAARLAGAAGGVIVGGVLGAAVQNHAKGSFSRQTVVKLDSGTVVHLQASDESTLRAGQRVWVALDAKGNPLEIIDIPAGI